MKKRLVISFALLLATAACAHRVAPPPAVHRGALPAPIDLSSASESELQQHVGELVTMRGRFSLRGKIGPFIVAADRPIYFVSKGSFSWGAEYEKMEGRDVRVTGTLRFIHYPETAPRDVEVGRVPDHFYFEAETTKIELSEK